MPNTDTKLVTPKFAVGDKVNHYRFGSGVVTAIYAVAAKGTDEETEYTVKLRGERYPATLGEHGLSFTGEADAVHELAHRENERRWAVEQTEALGLGAYSEDAEAIQDLLVRVRRNWRLSLQHPQATRYVKWCTAAATELETEYGVEVARQGNRGWLVEMADR